MSVSRALQWFISQPQTTLTNPLTRRYLLAVLNDAANSLTEITRRRTLRLSNDAQVNRLRSVTTANTELLARVGIDWLNPLERTCLATVLAAMSILPLTVDFSALANGALPAQFTGSTYAIVDGKLINNVTFGPELLTDPGLEVWASAINLTSYTETIAGTSTVNQETVTIHGGANAARLDVDVSNNFAYIQQSPAVALGDWLIARMWAKASTTGKTDESRLSNQYPESVVRAVPTTYTEYIHTAVVRLLSGFALRYGKLSAASSSLYVDDLSLKKITASTLTATVNPGVSDVTVKGSWMCPIGAVAGVIMNLDSTSNPQNYVALIVNGSPNYMSLLKCVAGQITQVVLLNTITYVDGRTVELRKSGTTFSAWYNGVQIGTNQTISDAGIISNTIHGLLSTYSGCQCSFFTAA